MVTGSAAFVIKEKLKLLKVSLRRWNLEVYGLVDIRVEDAISKINVCDDKFVYICGADGARGLVNMDVEVDAVSNEISIAACSFWNSIRRWESLLK